MNSEPGVPRSVACVVYRAARREGTYVFMRAEDGLETLPAALRAVTGRLEVAMELTLTPERRLARADVGEVMRALEEKGFYLQIPPPESDS